MSNNIYILNMCILILKINRNKFVILFNINYNMFDYENIFFIQCRHGKNVKIFINFYILIYHKLILIINISNKIIF